MLGPFIKNVQSVILTWVNGVSDVRKSKHGKENKQKTKSPRVLICLYTTRASVGLTVHVASEQVIVSLAFVNYNQYYSILSPRVFVCFCV